MNKKMSIDKPDRDPIAGFTLVELMVTVAIIALVAGFTFAELNTDSYLLKTTARTLKGNMQKARLLAVKNSCPVYVDFDFDAPAGVDNGYTLWQDFNQNGTCNDATADNNGDGVIDAHDAELIETVTLPNNISFGTVAASDGGPTAPPDIVTYGSYQLKFSPRGSSSNGYVYLYSPADDSAGTHRVGTNKIGRVRAQYYATGGGTWR